MNIRKNSIFDLLGYANWQESSEFNISQLLIFLSCLNVNYSPTCYLNTVFLTKDLLMIN